MIYFSFSEILLSILHALLYGVIFGSVYHVIRSLIFIIKSLVRFPKDVLFYNKLFFFCGCGIITIKSNENKFIGAAKAFLETVIFTLGYILLMYYAVDGEVRVYLLLFSLLGLKLSFVSKGVLFLVTRCLLIIEYCILIIFRLGFFPFHKLFDYLLNIYSRILSNLEKRLPKFKA